MSKTRIDLIYQTLDSLGVLIPGQSPAAEDVSKADGLLDPILASLEARGVVYVGDAGTPSPPSGGDIDDAIFLPVAEIVANRLAASFNVNDPRLPGMAKLAEEELRVIGRPDRARKTMKTDMQLRVGPYRRYATFNFTSGQ